MSVTGILSFLGGIGLFLLGMRLMTEGLKVAAGSGLRTILAQGTTTRMRALGAGVLITALVQSSSAVTFATIGFVNAGLLNLTQATGVILGANLGTTVTSWLVALVGFKFELKILALPAIALGMALRVSSSTRPRGALGEALAGFGVFFLGIDLLKDAFAGLETLVTLTGSAPGVGMILLFVAAGFLMTLAMQSSSAALVVTLTAAASGHLALEAAAAVVIGANVGTTSTAVFAVIGATAAARRAAAMHVAFNLVTAVIALALFGFLLAFVKAVGEVLTGGFQVATALALFHTLTKVIGVAIMLPLTPPLTRWLERRFITTEEDAARPRHLDANLATTPALALNALALELSRAREGVNALAIRTLTAGPSTWASVRQDQDANTRLLRSVGDYAGRISRAGVDADHLARALRINQYLADVVDRVGEVAALAVAADRPTDPGIAADLDGLSDLAVVVFRDGPTAGAAFHARYGEVKDALLRAGGSGRVPVAQMVAQLDRLSAIRRMVEQVVKADANLGQLMQEVGSASVGGEQ